MVHEAITKLEKIESGELTPRHQKSLKGFQKLKEYKFNKIRIIVNPGQKGGPDQILAILKRPKLDTVLEALQKRFK